MTTDNFDSADMDSDETAVSTVTLPVSCKMCSEIINLYQAPYDKEDYDVAIDGQINLGKVGHLLTDDCPHATWLRDIKYRDGPVPFYEKRDLVLNRWVHQQECTLNIHYHNRQTNVWASTPCFELVFRPEVPGHGGAVRNVDGSWIDLDIVKEWPLRCDRLHGEKCNETVGTVPPFKPRLLIDVVQGCVTECKEESPRFLTLSYTWGRSKNFRITKANVDEMKQPGVLTSDAVASKLPRTILDAIKLTNALGERWLWIDSLCIVQDDDESLRHELKSMHQIYATSFLTIVAVDGEDAEYGLRGLRGISEPREIDHVVLPLSGGERIAWIEDPHKDDRDQRELSYHERMWTSQEFHFSKRRLIFKDGQVKWECNCSAWSEDHIYRPEKESPFDVVYGRYVGRGKHLKVPSLSRLSQLICWSFNEKTLRYEEDVYNAFAGYNTYLSGIFPYGLVYGHPQMFFEQSLCWSSANGVRRRKVSERYTGDPIRNGLPSWSWMGWKGTINFPVDLESEEGASYDMGFTESITEWYAMEYPDSCEKQRINSTWSQCRKAPPGSMAENWRCEEFRPPAMAEKGVSSRASDPLSIPKELPSYIYTCFSDDTPWPITRWYPIPLGQANSEEEASLSLHSGYQYLWCQTFRAFFTASHDILYNDYGHADSHVLKNKDGIVVGALRLHNDGDSKLFQQDTPVELIAVAKGWSTILKVYSTEKPESPAPVDITQLSLEEEQEVKEKHQEYWSKAFEATPWMETWQKGKEDKQDCYHVLWIEWQNEVAYRKAYGMTRDILIVGATGQQGKATIDAIFKTRKQSDIRIIALTRSITSPKSQALCSQYPEIILVEGNTQTPKPIFEQYPSIASLFVVTVPPDDEVQAIPLIEEATSKTLKVDHIVFSSVDRGGNEVSWSTPTDIPHFAAKHRIEHRLRGLCEESGKRWTILRPTGFMDSYNPGFFGKMMASLWAEGMPRDRKMQLISTHDIGVFAAKALLDPEGWAGKAVALACDDLSFLELEQIFKQVVGEELPQTYRAVSWPILWTVKDASKSFEWFKTGGWKADIDGLRREEPGLQDFATWLRESSKWQVKDNM
ncbi:transcription factor [Fusarium flagelliforme]|uniref:Transcription factor n=1 Tax=Fusarium flagelliforme TaxID=2675880 RepID=A0A395MCE1_9HYPO|nr:transcription factor [Fusarium flagelliforme]